MKDGLKMFVYYRKGAETHTGIVVAHDLEEAKQMTLFPDTVKDIRELGEIIGTTYVNSVELL